jgi:multidrug resistance efflux pump
MADLRRRYESLAADNHEGAVSTARSIPRDLRTIPTPWSVRWMRFRYQVLPVFTLIASVAVIALLWQRHAGSGNAMGEVAAERVPISSNVDGVLAALPGRVINPHDRISEGDVIASMDPAPIQARRAARQVEVERLRAELATLESSPAQPAAATDAPGASREDRLQSLRTALATREEELAQLDLVLDSLDITAPVSGTVFKVYLRPGQLARAGDLIMEISADGADYVVGYLREEQQYIQPKQGMKVEVRPRTDPRRVVQGTVDTVGATVEAVPPRQLRDQKIPEWGLPVRLAIPANSNLRPGELVNLAFQTPP